MGSRVSDVTVELKRECFLKSNSSVIEFQTKQHCRDEKGERNHPKEIMDEQVEECDTAGGNLGNPIFQPQPGLSSRRWCCCLGVSSWGSSALGDPVLLGTLFADGEWKMSFFLRCVEKTCVSAGIWCHRFEDIHCK